MKDISSETLVFFEIERECIEAVKRGHNEAFATIVRKYMKRAYFIALSFVKTEQDALDVSQDAFIKAFRNIKKFDTTNAFFPWFYKILKNVCLDWLRKYRREDNTLPENTTLLAESANLDEMTKIQLWKEIEKLPSDQQEILKLRYFQGFSYKEISQVLEIPLGSVMSRLYYAKKGLRKKMEKYLG